MRTKRFAILIVLAASISLTGCSSDVQSSAEITPSEQMTESEQISESELISEREEISEPAENKEPEEESPSQETGVENKLNKDGALKIAEGLGNVCAIEYRDYDGDGTNEAYVAIGKEDKLGGYQIDGIWFIANDGTTEKMRSGFKDEEDLSMYKSDTGYYMEYAKEKTGFFYADCGGHGSGWITFVFGVRGGLPYELDISMKTEGFYQDKPGEFYTLTDDFTDGHKYMITPLYYSSNTKQFTKGIPTDRNWLDE